VSETFTDRDLILDVVGNTSPFSMAGESSGYMVTVAGRSYLLECGSKIFSYLGPEGIGRLQGIFATHSHEDHKRWFTDIVLFTYYNPAFDHRVRLISSEPVLQEFAKNSKGALERSLSFDSKRVVDIPFDRMVESTVIGPRSRYFIEVVPIENGAFRFEVRDRSGNAVGPEKAKIFLHPSGTRPRLLFRDEESGEWVEPDSYYPFSSRAFYERERNPFVDEASGMTVTAVKSPVWHGLPTVAFRFSVGENHLLFSADTVYKPSLWESLFLERRPQRFESIHRDEFLRSRVIYGDINDFIERTWSRERYEAALTAYDEAVVVHDVARKNSVVHTDYPDIANAPIDKLIFTHSPDNLTAFRPILHGGQRIVIRGGDAYECVDGRILPFDADVYVRHFGGNLVGYRSSSGGHKVVEEGGLLGVVPLDHPGRSLMRIDLYEDVGGDYFPLLPDTRMFYRRREDGKVERVTQGRETSRGTVVEGLRRGNRSGP
jgi:ribonuclease BN (tRNA processing enzyme)